MRVAADADAGSVDLGQPVDVVDGDAHLVLDAFAGLLAPTLGSDDAALQVDLVAQAALVDLFGEQQRIRAGRGNDRGSQVLHHLQLLVGIAWTGRDGHGAQALATELKADAGCPQAVTWGYLHAVFIRDAGDPIAAGEHVGPVVHVPPRVGNDDRRARRAR